MTDLQNEPPRDAEGLEEKGARVLNGGMVMVLAMAVAILALWGIFDFLRSVFQANPGFSWRDEIVMGLLVPIGLLPTAVSMFFWGFRIPRSKSRL